MVLKTKPLDVSKFYDGVHTTITIRKFNAGDLAEIRDSVQVNMIGDMQSAKPQMGQLFLLTLLKGIHEAPFLSAGKKLDMTTVKEIDGELADFLAAEINSYNNISPNL